MKTLVVIAILVIVTCPVARCAEPGGVRSRVSITVGPALKITNLSDRDKLWPGLIMELKPMQEISVGASYFSGIPVQLDPRRGPHPDDLFIVTEEFRMLRLHWRYGSHLLAPLHSSFGIALGRGWLTLKRDEGGTYHDYFGTDGFWVAEPEFSLEAHPFRHLSLSGAVGLLLVDGVNRWGYSNREVNSVTSTLSLRYNH